MFRNENSRKIWISVDNRRRLRCKREYTFHGVTTRGKALECNQVEESIETIVRCPKGKAYGFIRTHSVSYLVLAYQSRGR